MIHNCESCQKSIKQVGMLYKKRVNGKPMRLCRKCRNKAKLNWYGSGFFFN